MQPSPPMPETFTVSLVGDRRVTSRVRELRFERVDRRPFTFQAGQWVSLVAPLVDPKGRPVRRSYSISSVPTVSATGFELVVTRVEGGLMSNFLHELPVGATLEVKGPQGSFVRHLLPAHPALFVATGTGIAPFRGMVAEALAAGRTEPLWVLFGVRTLDDGLYLEEFQALARHHPFVRLELSLSQPAADWQGRRGYVQTQVRELWTELARLGAPEAYICGVMKMLTEVRAVLKGELAVERSRLHAESYG
jgi:ferredoxin-NADP reductase